MNLNDLIKRNMPPLPWREGEKIPWNDPHFSRRMLREHLSQKHDAASRRLSKVKKHIQWIQATVLSQAPANILDLGCGPGLYAAELARLGHVVHGIDFSPASIEYAVNHAPPGCAYTLGDIRTTGFGAGYDLAMLIFGEFNVFQPEDAALILRKAHAALKPGGRLLLECSTFDSIYDTGNQPSMWYTAESGLFADGPHLCLMESAWDDAARAATERYFIVDPATGGVTGYASSSQAYEEANYRQALRAAGFIHIQFFPSLTGKDPNPPDGLQVIVAEK